jgi:hypothetical protein
MMVNPVNLFTTTPINNTAQANNSATPALSYSSDIVTLSEEAIRRMNMAGETTTRITSPKAHVQNILDVVQ